MLTSERARIPQLDALRGIACLLVLFDHLYSIPIFFRFENIRLFNGGFIGVDIFFVLSGFLISFLLCKEITQSGTINIKKFFWRRVLRLTPALVVALVIFTIPILLFSGGRVWFKDYFYLLTYTTIWPKLLEIFRLLPQPTYFPQAWSLSVEEFFYLLFPFLLLSQKGKLNRLVWILIALFFVGAVTLSFSLSVLQGGAYHNPVWHFGQIGMGVIGGMYSFGIRSDAIASEFDWAKRLQPYLQELLNSSILLALAVGYIFVVFTTGTPGKDSAWLFQGGFAVQTLCILFVLLSVAQGTNELPILKNPGLQYVGTVSYAAYVYHYPIYLISQTLLTGKLGMSVGESFTAWLIVDILLISTTLLAAHLSYVLVERHALKYKNHFQSLPDNQN